MSLLRKRVLVLLNELVSLLLIFRDAESNVITSVARGKPRVKAYQHVVVFQAGVGFSQKIVLLLVRFPDLCRTVPGRINRITSPGCLPMVRPVTDQSMTDLSRSKQDGIFINLESRPDFESKKPRLCRGFFTSVRTRAGYDSSVARGTFRHCVYRCH